MSRAFDNLRESVVEYCSTIGIDPLLVQGAGGNVSWKDGNTLWVKASGTWLADAAEKNVFVPVDMSHLQTAIKYGDFSITPKLSQESPLRPSIETLLHALMPHKIVIHLHAIEILAHLVRDKCEDNLQLLVDPAIRWTAVEYHKPGAALAAALHSALAPAAADVVFLKNHGVVIGGTSIDDVTHILNTLTTNLSTPATPTFSKLPQDQSRNFDAYIEYSPTPDLDIHQLALNPNLFARLDSDWALYPDHVVFLGPRAYIYKTWGEFREKNTEKNEQPELIFIREEGVFVTREFSTAKQAQLRCYYDILARQTSRHALKTLTSQEIVELLNWDAEKYRQLIAK